MAASVCKLSVSNSLDGKTITLSDIGSYTAPVTSRIVTVTDAYGNLLDTIIFGSSLTEPWTVPADAWYSFQLLVTDALGSYTDTVNFLAENQYIASFLNAMVFTGCGCGHGQFCNLNKAELNLAAAERYALGGNSAAADTTITAANVYVNMQ